MKMLTDFILQFGQLNEQQTDLISSKAKEQILYKDEYFAEAGKVPNQTAFVLEGVLRFCYYNNKGEEITNSFVSENSFVVDYPRFEAGVPSSEYIHAVTDCKLLVFRKKDWDELQNTIIGWDKMVAKIYQKCLLQAIDNRSPMVSEDATTRYLNFLEQFPLLANRVPLAYIASYLGITQQSLSRIRKNIR